MRPRAPEARATDTLKEQIPLLQESAETTPPPMSERSSLMSLGLNSDSSETGTEIIASLPRTRTPSAVFGPSMVENEGPEASISTGIDAVNSALFLLTSVAVKVMLISVAPELSKNVWTSQEHFPEEQFPLDLEVPGIPKSLKSATTSSISFPFTPTSRLTKPCPLILVTGLPTASSNLALPSTNSGGVLSTVNLTLFSVLCWPT